MAEHETLPVSGAVHNSVVVDEAVESLHYGRILIDIFDSAMVMKTDDGAVRALRKHGPPTRKGLAVDEGCRTGDLRRSTRVRDRADMSAQRLSAKEQRGDGCAGEHGEAPGLGLLRGTTACPGQLASGGR